MQYHPRALVGDGGISNSVRRLSGAMAAEGAQPVIAYRAADGESPSDTPVEWHPVVHRGVGGIEVPVGLGEVLQGADLLVLNSAWTTHNVRAGAVARRTSVPYVVADRGAYDPLIRRRRARVKGLWWMAFERRLVTGASALHVFFPSQAAAIRELGYDGQILVAPNGVEVPDDVVWDGGSGGYVLYLGRFDPEHKGLDLLLRGLARLPAGERPHLRLRGPDWRGGKARTDALVRELGLVDWVQVGPAAYGDEKWRLFREAAAFAYPSRWEGFGNAPAEAAAIGVPLLVTPYPLGSWFGEQGAAVVAQPESEALAEGLLAVTAPDAADMGGRARAAAAQFTWRSVARTWLEQAAALR